MKPRLLDLFCGAGGASEGYHRAGFEVVGVDIRPQPNYPFQFVQADALEMLSDAMRENGPDRWRPIDDFAAIHASPPCEAFIRGGLQSNDWPDLLTPVRGLLEQTGLPWVIENVPGAPMRPDVQLCGSQFDLPVRRHRWFELSWGETVMTLACDHSRPIVGVYGNPHGQAGAWPGMLPGTSETWQRGLGIDWTDDPAELKQAIPPVYTELIGAQLLAHLEAKVAA